MSQRFFAVDMLPQLQRRQRSEGVGMLAGANHNRVEFVRVVVKLAVIRELPCVGVLLRGRADSRIVDVAEGDDVLGSDRAQVGTSSTARTDDGDIQAFVEIP